MPFSPLEPKKPLIAFLIPERSLDGSIYSVLTDCFLYIDLKTPSLMHSKLELR